MLAYSFLALCFATTFNYCAFAADFDGARRMNDIEVPLIQNEHEVDIKMNAKKDVQEFLPAIRETLLKETPLPAVSCTLIAEFYGTPTWELYAQDKIYDCPIPMLCYATVQAETVLGATKSPDITSAHFKCYHTRSNTWKNNTPAEAKLFQSIICSSAEYSGRPIFSSKKNRTQVAWTNLNQLCIYSPKFPSKLSLQLQLDRARSHGCATYFALPRPSIAALDLSTDGDFLFLATTARASLANSIIKIDMRHRQLEIIAQELQHPITALACSDDGTMVAVGFTNGLAQQWSNILTRTLTHKPNKVLVSYLLQPASCLQCLIAWACSHEDRFSKEQPQCLRNICRTPSQAESYKESLRTAFSCISASCIAPYLLTGFLASCCCCCGCCCNKELSAWVS